MVQEIFLLVLKKSMSNKQDFQILNDSLFEMGVVSRYVHATPQNQKKKEPLLCIILL